MLCCCVTSFLFIIRTKLLDFINTFKDAFEIDWLTLTNLPPFGSLTHRIDLIEEKIIENVDMNINLSADSCRTNFHRSIDRYIARDIFPVASRNRQTGWRIARVSWAVWDACHCLKCFKLHTIIAMWGMFLQHIIKSQVKLSKLN